MERERERERESVGGWVVFGDIVCPPPSSSPTTLTPRKQASTHPFLPFFPPTTLPSQANTGQACWTRRARPRGTITKLGRERCVACLPACARMARGLNKALRRGGGGLGRERVCQLSHLFSLDRAPLYPRTYGLRAPPPALGVAWRFVVDLVGLWSSSLDLSVAWGRGGVCVRVCVPAALLLLQACESVSISSRGLCQFVITELYFVGWSASQSVSREDGGGVVSERASRQPPVGAAWRASEKKESNTPHASNILSALLFGSCLGSCSSFFFSFSLPLLSACLHPPVGPSLLYHY